MIMILEHYYSPVVLEVPIGMLSIPACIISYDTTYQIEKCVSISPWLQV